MTPRPSRQPAAAPDDVLLDARAAMAYLGVSRTFLTDHLAALGGIKLGGTLKGRLRFRRSSLEAYVLRCQVQPEVLEPEPSAAPVTRPVLVHKGAINKVTGKKWNYYGPGDGL